MTLPVYRLRRILAATAILLILVVAGMYFYARSKATDVLKSIPGKMGYDIKQTASGFQFSKSDGKRTLFTVQASDVKQFKLNGNAELHNVSIILYGRDSSRFDQIYGDNFAFNQKTGEVTATGDVQIDLVANPAGLASPDQSTPRELKNPIHLKTRDLAFNRDTGNASTDARVEFRTPQASGWAVGVKYAGKTHTFTLSSQVHVELSGANAATIEAEHGVITDDPRQIVLEHPRMDRESGTLQADQATFYIGAQNQVERISATGNITTETRTNVVASRRVHNPSTQPSDVQARADHAEFLFAPEKNLLRTATLTGRVHIEQSGVQPMRGDAGRMILDFSGHDALQKVHALDGVHLIEASSGKSVAPGKNSSNAPQDFDLTAPAMDFTVVDGRLLRHAETSGAAQIMIAQKATSGANPTAGQQTVVTAGKFTAEFSAADGRNHLASVRGTPNARIVDSSPGLPDRISSSDSVDAVFLPQGGIDSLTQTGNVTYSDGQDPAKRMQVWANSGHYTPADQMLVLTGSPRITSGSMQTTADTVKINRSNGEAQAQGNVKSTYSDLKEQPNGALLASASPIHVTSQSMTAHRTPGIAIYSGRARLWQEANIIEAPTIQFDRERRSVTALGSASQPVTTILVQIGTAKNGETSAKKAAASPVAITGQKLTYIDSERRAHYDGGVLAKGSDFTASSNTLDAFLMPRLQAAASEALKGPGQLDRIIAEGSVSIQQPSRRADGQKLVYTTADEKFVLTGGPPSIFDAEHGKITGVSLTFFRRDDRVLVEGEASSPVVTTTRVAR